MAGLRKTDHILAVQAAKRLHYKLETLYRHARPTIFGQPVHTATDT